MYTLSCTNLIYAQDEKTCKYMLLLWPKHYCVGSHYFLLLVFLWYIFMPSPAKHTTTTTTTASFSNRAINCHRVAIYTTYVYVHFNPMFIKICFTYIYLQLISYIFFYFQFLIQGKKISLEQVTHITNIIKRVFCLW